MKKTLLTLLSVLFCAITFAQSVPQGINYQAVARDANGAVLMNQALTIQFSVISDITTSAVSWQETHTVSTNDYGLYTAIIGQGTATSVGSSASFDVIDWGASNHLLKVEVDFGSGYLDMGTTAFMSVPYAINSTPQSLTISGDTLFISSGNYIILPSSAPTLLGCTDPTAFNYNASANTDDGSCIAVVNGCTDSTAFNYNAAANTDDGSCIAVVNGCTDSTATNYNAAANTDDGSCIAVVNGCTDPTATNYNAAANTDDGSCTYPCLLDEVVLTMTDSYDTDDGSCIYPCLLDEVVLTMTDSYGDGWNGGTLTIDGVTYDQPTTAPSGTGGASDTYTLCVDLSTCIAVTYSAGQWSSENSWSISDASGTVLASGGNVSGQFGTCIAVVLGCTDSTATNYNAAANTDDGSCIAVVNGCTDPTAFNYNAAANTDDGSCIAVVLGCTDSTAYSGYNPLANTDDGSCIGIGSTYQGGIIFWLDGNGGGLISAPTDQSSGQEWGCDGTNITGAGGTAIGTGTQNTIDIINANCTSSDGSPIAADICANLTLGGYSDWFLPSKDELNEMYVNLHQQGLGGFANVLYWSSTEGSSTKAWIHSFTTGNVFNVVKDDYYDVRAVRAIGVVLGCTDLTAFNYNALANSDDGSCIAVVLGCTDSTAYSGYNPLANTDDGSCIIYGCTDSTAFNYNANANIDDGSCIAVVNGCTDSTATNYNPLANTDDYSCLVIGNYLFGGIIFWLDGNGGGLIAATSDQSTGAEWGCDGTNITGAGGTAIGTGTQNTIDIINANCTSSDGSPTAADICANLTLGGYSDWFLPSKDELNEMYLNKAAIGGFAGYGYWSSTEYDSNNAWRQSFADGYQYGYDKDYGTIVRAVRAF